MKKILRNSAIILTIIIFLMNIFLYVEMKQVDSELLLSKEAYESAGLLISSIFQFGLLIWGFGLILIVWIEYFLCSLFIKIYNRFSGIKRALQLLAVLLAILILLVVSIGIIRLIFIVIF